MSAAGGTRREQVVICVGLVVDDSGHCLLVRRHEPALPELHGRWELPGGKVEFGEAPTLTVEREVLEETGVTVSAGSMLPFPFSAVRTYEGVERQPIILCFRCRLIARPTLPHSLPAKIGEVRWVARDALASIELQRGTRAFVRHAPA